MAVQLTFASSPWLLKNENIVGVRSVSSHGPVADAEYRSRQFHSSFRFQTMSLHHGSRVGHWRVRGRGYSTSEPSLRAPVFLLSAHSKTSGA